MSDVYDVGRYIWCELCEVSHEPCEPVDLTFECCTCPQSEAYRQLDRACPQHGAAAEARRQRVRG